MNPVYFVALQQMLNKPYLPVKSRQTCLNSSSSNPEAIGFFQKKENKGIHLEASSLPMHAKGTSSSIGKTRKKTTE